MKTGSATSCSCSSRLSLVEALDRLLHRGVVLSGQATISLADVDLVHLGLHLVLAASGTLAGRGAPATAALTSETAREEVAQAAAPPAPPAVPAAKPVSAGLHPMEPGTYSDGEQRPVGGVSAEHRAAFSPPNAPDDSAPCSTAPSAETPTRGLARLVLTLVELLRQLVERQAVRRIEGGGLTDAQIERMGRALMELDAKMSELCAQFGLEREELDIDLGPLGRLLP
jgi:hypothetical protein